ncbi:MAG: hypothetical protein ACR2M4_08430 [Actinomycetota bacterium]
MEIRSVWKGERAWRPEIDWFLAGALFAAGVLLGVTSILYLPFALFGAAWAASLLVQGKPAAWMLVAGLGAATAVLYAIDIFGGRGTCPYSSVTFLDGGQPRCGPPDELRIFVLALIGALAGGSLALRSRRRRLREEPRQADQEG